MINSDLIKDESRFRQHVIDMLSSIKEINLKQNEKLEKHETKIHELEISRANVLATYALLVIISGIVGSILTLIISKFF